MTIVNFFKELSSLVDDYRVDPSEHNENKLEQLVVDAKASGLVIDVDLSNLKSAALSEVFDEVQSLESYSLDEDYDDYDNDGYED